MIKMEFKIFNTIADKESIERLQNGSLCLCKSDDFDRMEHGFWSLAFS